MADCPNCEYHKNRAARWRVEAYIQAGHDVIERPWVGLTDVDYSILAEEFTGADGLDCVDYGRAIEAKLKEKNKMSETKKQLSDEEISNAWLFLEGKAAGVLQEGGEFNFPVEFYKYIKELTE